MRRQFGVRLVVVLALGMAVTGSAAEAGAEGGSQTKTGVVRKVDLDASALVVLVARELTFTVTNGTAITEGAMPRTLADVKVGASVTVEYAFAAGRNRVASRIMVTTPTATPAATAADLRVDFTLNTRDAQGAPLQQKRFYWVYRPDGLSRTASVPMVISLDGGKPGMFHRKADQAGFLAISCSFSGNSTGTPGTVWINDDPRVSGYEDFDYITEVIRRVRAAENGGDAFIVGLSKGGHMSLAYACERPSLLRAAASVDEFMGLTSNRPTAPLPIIVFQGTSDSNVSYTMVRDTVEAWRAVDGLLNTVPVTTYESSPRLPGRVSQATWQGGTGATQVAFVTLVGGSHTYPRPGIETGYDVTAGLWAFFSQFLSPSQGPPRVVSQPVDNVQPAGQPASFRVVVTGAGPLTYQWQKNGEDIPGATESWLTIPAVTPADHGTTLRAVVRNAAGSATSAAATLTLTEAPPGPAVSVPPASQVVTAGQPAKFTVSATGVPPLRYQWRRNGIDIPGAIDATYSLPVSVPFDSGAVFSAVVADGTGPAVSPPAVLAVVRPPGAPIIIANPARVRLLAGQSATFLVSAWSASPLRYQWQRGTFAGHMLDIPGATDVTYTTPPATVTEHHALFRCVVSNAAGSIASASEMLFVTTAPKAPNQIISASAASAQVGAPFSYLIASSGGTIPLVCSAEPLPPGLSVDPASGRISGTPTETGSTRIVVDAGNSVGRTSATLTLTVTATPPAVDLGSWRLAHFGASAMDPASAGDAADPDADGQSNLEEFARQSNPLD
jgi:poly(3-hydroxybutyrate) depolymerase